MRLLDLFCGAGGAAMGYHRAGFDDIVGVDIKPQKHYPFAFVQADALEYVAEHGHEFDAIHASPPCQRYSHATPRNRRELYPDLVGATRNALNATGNPWVIENVPGSPLRADIRVCGCQVGLPIRRVRYFETSWNHSALMRPCQHNGPVLSVVGNGTPTWVIEQFGRIPTRDEYCEAMGIGWMTRAELSQAIPPAYTEFIGRHLLAVLAEHDR